MNKRVSLSKRVATDSGPRYCTAVIASNGRVKPNHVIVDGREESHSEGSYYVSWYQGKKLVRKSVGKDANKAAAARFKQEQLLQARNAGIPISEEAKDGIRLADAAAVYLDRIKITRKPKTDVAYKGTLDKFLNFCQKRHLEDVDHDDLINFAAHLRDHEKLAPRTVANQFGTVVSFLKASGREKIVKRGDWPRYVEEEPEVYEPEDLEAFFKHCDSDELCLFQFLQMTGMREKEAMHVEWSDVNFARATVAVRQKPQYGHTPKNFRERTIPIPDKLVAALKKRTKTKLTNLIFPSANNRPDGHLLRRLHNVVKRASLNTAEWWLHKFRATFATTALRGGVDPRTVQSWMGHSDIASTMRYLAPASSHTVRDKVNKLF